MHRMATDLLHVKICTDQTSLSMLTPEQKHDWQNLLTIQHVAVLIIQYFCTNKQADQTLMELFGKIPFHYSLPSGEEELATYMAYRELITDYERTRRITSAQQAELVSILRLARGSRIQADYLESKRNDSVSPNTWEVAILRIISVVTTARATIRMSRSYGNPDTIYSFPSTAIPPPRSSRERGSTFAIREAETFRGKSTLASRTSFDVPPVASLRVCRSCGNPAHVIKDCPALYYTDSNTDYHCDWSESVVGKAWVAYGEAMWQEKLILSGYEDRRLHYPKGFEPFLMSTNKKAKTNQGYGKGSNQNTSNN